MAEQSLREAINHLQHENEELKTYLRRLINALMTEPLNQLPNLIEEIEIKFDLYNIELKKENKT